MRAAGKIFAFLIGAGIGTYVAFYMVIAGDDSKGIGRAIVLIESPVIILAQWIFGTMGIGLYMILHLGFWFFFGGLLCLGFAVLLSKLEGSD